MKLHSILKRGDMLKCALCKDAPCDRACPKGQEPARKLRSVWFANEETAALSLPEKDICRDCPAPCEEACLRPGQVPIRGILSRLSAEVLPLLDEKLPADEAALRTDLCGVPLDRPQRAKLLSLPNVLLISHMAFYTEQAVGDMVRNSVDHQPVLEVL